MGPFLFPFKGLLNLRFEHVSKQHRPDDKFRAALDVPSGAINVSLRQVGIWREKADQPRQQVNKSE